MAFERALFDSDGLRIGFWTAKEHGLVCPQAYESRAGFENAKLQSKLRGWPVSLRPTGGGTVPQGPSFENVVVAFVPRDDATITSVYKDFTEALSTGLGSNDLEPGDTPGSFCDGTWNLSFNGQKVVGTAQRWRPRTSKAPRVIAHALIVTRSDFRSGAEEVARFHKDLGLSDIVPDAHTSLEETLGLSRLPTAEITAALRAKFGQDQI